MSTWTERERAAYRRQMARRKAIPLAEFPNGRMWYESDLDITPGERTGIVVGYALVTLAIVGALLAPLFIGGLILAVFGW